MSYGVAEIAYVCVLFVGGVVNLARGLAHGRAVDAAAITSADDGGAPDGPAAAAPDAATVDAAHRGFRLRASALVLLNASVWFAVGVLEVCMCVCVCVCVCVRA